MLFPLLAVLAGQDAIAATYQEPEAFLDEVFAGSVPKPAVVWLRGEVKATTGEILGHPYRGLRIRYWGQGQRSAWILEEIGKERPITVGHVVDDGQLSLVRVLIFRESRGWEVRYPSFTDQFRSASLTTEQKLDSRIDGISGATLSVRALKKLARLALYLHTQTPHSDAAPQDTP